MEAEVMPSNRGAPMMSGLKRAMMARSFGSNIPRPPALLCLAMLWLLPNPSYGQAHVINQMLLSTWLQVFPAIKVKNLCSVCNDNIACDQRATEAYDKCITESEKLARLRCTSGHPISGEMTLKGYEGGVFLCVPKCKKWTEKWDWAVLGYAADCEEEDSNKFACFIGSETQVRSQCVDEYRNGNESLFKELGAEVEINIKDIIKVKISGSVDLKSAVELPGFKTRCLKLRNDLAAECANCPKVCAS